MSVQRNMREPESTIAVIAYELNAVALKLAAEAEQLLHRNCFPVVDGARVEMEIVTRMDGLIGHLHEASLALRYVRHTGQMPPRWPGSK
ncbi:hypothetical protein [Magnetospirillum moscoviense]|uniref:Uncharacterized protein n=1 Tax=Magnetospirillum moscoviense TaxID=1437059 RepID=A0A178MR59_9PROT|nr:hypothetical protein [Magnetospirillum moscoviense]MBF0324526.1 hypothetical protein [Alphaproteobacteria bacterium]OAN51549.1 hypothetical protein A6A05_01420 [Magnetospirillum moscoviense]